jgi:hypothetical protein
MGRLAKPKFQTLAANSERLHAARPKRKCRFVFDNERIFRSDAPARITVHCRRPNEKMKEWTAEDIISGLENLDFSEVERIADKIGDILAGKHPGIQGCALAQTLALWLMGHEDAKVRERLLTAHIETVRALIEK